LIHAVAYVLILTRISMVILGAYLLRVSQVSVASQRALLSWYVTFVCTVYTVYFVAFMIITLRYILLCIPTHRHNVLHFVASTLLVFSCSPSFTYLLPSYVDHLKNGSSCITNCAFFVYVRLQWTIHFICT